MAGVWDPSSRKVELEKSKRSGLISLWADFVEWRMDRRKREHQRLLRNALIGERPPNIEGATGLWTAFLTLEGVMALLTGLVMYSLYAPAFRDTAQGWVIGSRLSLAGLVVIFLSLAYMVAVALGVYLYKDYRRKLEARYQAIADQAMAEVADKQPDYHFSVPEDEAEAELLHEHDRLALVGKPLGGPRP
jgi:hypothetical protein